MLLSVNTMVPISICVLDIDYQQKPNGNMPPAQMYRYQNSISEQAYGLQTAVDTSLDLELAL